MGYSVTPQGAYFTLYLRSNVRLIPRILPLPLLMSSIVAVAVVAGSLSTSTSANAAQALTTSGVASGAEASAGASGLVVIPVQSRGVHHKYAYTAGGGQSITPMRFLYNGATFDVTASSTAAEASVIVTPTLRNRYSPSGRTLTVRQVNGFTVTTLPMARAKTQPVKNYPYSAASVRASKGRGPTHVSTMCDYYGRVGIVQVRFSFATIQITKGQPAKTLHRSDPYLVTLRCPGK